MHLSSCLNQFDCVGCFVNIHLSCRFYGRYEQLKVCDHSFRYHYSSYEQTVCKKLIVILYYIRISVSNTTNSRSHNHLVYEQLGLCRKHMYCIIDIHVYSDFQDPSIVVEFIVNIIQHIDIFNHC